jgi:hypothetical protein
MERTCNALEGVGSVLPPYLRPMQNPCSAPCAAAQPVNLMLKQDLRSACVAHAVQRTLCSSSASQTQAKTRSMKCMRGSCSAAHLVQQLSQPRVMLLQLLPRVDAAVDITPASTYTPHPCMCTWSTQYVIHARSICSLDVPMHMVQHKAATHCIQMLSYSSSRRTVRAERVVSGQWPSYMCAESKFRLIFWHLRQLGSAHRTVAPNQAWLASAKYSSALSIM